MKFFPATVYLFAFLLIAGGAVVLFRETGWVQGFGYALIVLGFYLGAAIESVDVTYEKGDKTDGT